MPNNSQSPPIQLATEIQPVSPGHDFGEDVPKPQKGQYLICARCVLDKSRCLLKRGESRCIQCSLVHQDCVFITYQHQKPDSLWYDGASERIVRMESKIENVLQYWGHLSHLAGYGSEYRRKKGALVGMSNLLVLNKDKAAVLEEITVLEPLIFNLPPNMPLVVTATRKCGKDLTIDLLVRINVRLRRLRTAYRYLQDRFVEMFITESEEAIPQPSPTPPPHLEPTPEPEHEPALSLETPRLLVGLKDFDKELEERPEIPQFAIERGIYTPPVPPSPKSVDTSKYDTTEIDDYINEICPLPRHQRLNVE